MARTGCGPLLAADLIGVDEGTDGRVAALLRRFALGVGTDPGLDFGKFRVAFHGLAGQEHEVMTVAGCQWPDPVGVVGVQCKDGAGHLVAEVARDKVLGALHVVDEVQEAVAMSRRIGERDPFPVEFGEFVLRQVPRFLAVPLAIEEYVGEGDRRFDSVAHPVRLEVGLEFIVRHLGGPQRKVVGNELNGLH